MTMITTAAWPIKYLTEVRLVRHQWQIDPDDAILSVTATATAGMQVQLTNDLAGRETFTEVSGGDMPGRAFIDYRVELASGQVRLWREPVNLRALG